MNTLKHMLNNPSCLDYIKDQARSNFGNEREDGERRPFGVNRHRFGGDDNGVPGAGTYKLPDSCQVKEPGYTHASTRSKVEKGLDQVIGRDNPGIGEYDTQHHKTIANKEFQGGASNNFVLFTRQNYQSRSPPIKESPRLHPHHEPTPRDVGPGSYLEKRNASITNATTGGLLNSTQSLQASGVQRGYMSNNLHFGVTDRFTVDEKFMGQPGPGYYNEQNKWNKRTYNLKFLNFQAQAFNTVAPGQGDNSNKKAANGPHHNRSVSLDQTLQQQATFQQSL